MSVGIVLRTLPWDTEVNKCFADILDAVHENFASDFPSHSEKNSAFSYLHVGIYLQLKQSSAKH